MDGQQWALLFLVAVVIWELNRLNKAVGRIEETIRLWRSADDLDERAASARHARIERERLRYEQEKGDGD